MKVGVIGHLGGPEHFVDGQTVKTKNLVMLLEKAGFSVVKADTYFNKVNKVKLLADTLWCLLRCRHVFLLVSEGGMGFYLPFLYYLNKVTKRHIYHYIIGSELLAMVEKNGKLVRYLNALDANWFEYEGGTQYLKSKGVTNVSTLPNFKMITPVAEACRYTADDGVCRFCTFSRVMEEKGITDAIKAVRDINAEQGRLVAALDIYGPVEPKYKAELDRMLRENPGCVSYKGVADSTQSVQILKDYYALLFPTRWAGEGVPGTVIDAFAAGIPVIASDWNANREIIQHKKQGLLYPNDIMSTLRDAIRWSMEHAEEMNQMRMDSREEFSRYMPETILQVILDEMAGSCDR